MTATEESRAEEPVTEEITDPDDDLFDESWDAPKKSNRLTVGRGNAKRLLNWSAW